MSLKRTAVLGAGSWGTALAVIWARRGNDVVMWGHNPERAARAQAARENLDYLPGVQLPESLTVTSEIADCAGADLVVFVTPSMAVRSVTEILRPQLRKDAVLLSCTKGIEHGSGLRMSEILAETLPDHTVAVLSGPNLAVEVARDLPTATVLGCRQSECAEELQQYLGSPAFRIYSSAETTAIELGGALKNIYAISAGVCDGFGLGDNSKSALVTRALAEMLRLGTAMGGDARTFYGLSGAGDLIATCFSRLSRNRGVGERLGKGETLEAITSSVRTVAEGVPTAKSAYECAQKLQVETPLLELTYQVLYEGKQPAQALQDLLSRDQKAEGF